MEAQRGKARAKSGFEAEKKSDDVRASADASASWQNSAISSRAIRARRWPAFESLRLFDQGRQSVQALGTGQTGYVVLERTPFYLEAGGQVSDVGRIFTAGGRRLGDRRGNVAPANRTCRVRTAFESPPGTLQVGDIVTAEVDGRDRELQPGEITPRRICFTRRYVRCWGTT